MKNLLLLTTLFLFTPYVWGQDNIYPNNTHLLMRKGDIRQTGNYNIQSQGAFKLKNYLLFDSDGDFTGGNYYTIQDDPSGNYLRMGYGFRNHLILNSIGNIGLGTTTPSSRLSIRNVGSTDGVKLLDFSELNDEEFILKGYFLGTGPTGNRMSLGSGNTNWQANIMSWRGDGNVGIGVNNPTEKLHLSSGTTGDAVLKLEADTDNSAEGDNARIEMSQDGGSLGVYIGFNQDWAGASSEPDNLFRIGTRYSNNDDFNSLVINTSNGNVGIGLSNPESKLTVDGGIRGEEVVVNIVNGPDYVFEEDYDLRTLKETKGYISKNKHLPEIPSAKEMEEQGVAVGEMNMKLLKKIEELTLYQIELMERLDEQNKRVIQLEEKLHTTEKD